MRKFNFVAEGLSDADEEKSWNPWDEYNYYKDNFFDDDFYYLDNKAEDIIQKENNTFRNNCRFIDMVRM